MYIDKFALMGELGEWCLVCSLASRVDELAIDVSPVENARWGGWYLRSQPPNLRVSSDQPLRLQATQFC